MVGKYNGDAFKTYEKIIDGMKVFVPNKVCKNQNHNIYYYINNHGYIHILKPNKITIDGKILYFTIGDYLLTKNNTLQAKKHYEKFRTLKDAKNKLEGMTGTIV